MNTDYKEFRSKVTKNIENFIKNKKIAINIEKGIYNYTIRKSKSKDVVRKWENKYFLQIYNDRFKSIYFNLNPKISTCNKDLVEKIKTKKIKSTKLTYMTHQEMNKKKMG